MLLTMEKILCLKSAPIFAGMTGDELRVLAGIVEEVEFKANSIIFNEDDPGEELYIIARGSVRIIRGSAATGAVLATLGEKDCLGEMAILDDDPRSATAQAVDDVLALKIHRDDFRELIREEPEVAFGIFRVFTRRIRHANEEQEQQASAPMQGSV